MKRAELDFVLEYGQVMISLVLFAEVVAVLLRGRLSSPRSFACVMVSGGQSAAFTDRLITIGGTAV